MIPSTPSHNPRLPTGPRRWKSVELGSVHKMSTFGEKSIYLSGKMTLVQTHQRHLQTKDGDGLGAAHAPGDEGTAGGKSERSAAHRGACRALDRIPLVCGFLLLAGGRRVCDADQTLLAQTRAMEQWEERGEDEEQRWTNMELAKDEHAQAKYVYVEMAGKERFCREIRDGDEQMVRDVEGATERMEESRQEVKDAKVHVTEFKDSITALISQTLVKKEEFEAEVDALSKIVEEREAPGADGGLLSEPEVADAEAKIVDKQQLLQRVDEGKLKDLHQEKQQLEVSVRTKNEEIETSKPGPGPNFRETKNRRMAAWYRSANTALCSLANVVSVTMAESAAEVRLPFPTRIPPPRKARVCSAVQLETWRLTPATRPPESSVLTVCVGRVYSWEGSISVSPGYQIREIYRNTPPPARPWCL